MPFSFEYNIKCNGTVVDTAIVTGQISNSAPVITSAASSVTKTTCTMSTADFGITVTDPNSDTVTYLWEDVSPNGSVTIADNTLLVTDISFNGVSGSTTASYAVKLTVSDGNLSTSQVFNITKEANKPAQLESKLPDFLIEKGAAFSYQIPTSSFSDPENDPVSFFLSVGMPSGISFDKTTRTFSGTPTSSNTYGNGVLFKDTGSCANGASVGAWFGWTVYDQADSNNPLNTAMVTLNNSVNVPYLVCEVGVPVDYPLPPAASFINDPAGRAFELSGASLPPGLSVDTAANKIVGTPTTSKLAGVLLYCKFAGTIYAARLTSFPIKVEPAGTGLQVGATGVLEGTDHSFPGY